MPRKPAHLRNEIFRRCAKLDQVSDASRRLKRQPIDEVRVIPQGRMLPNSIKVTAERGIRAWVLGLCNRLRKVAGVAEFDGAQCSEENVERLILWKLRSSVERGGRPLIWADRKSTRLNSSHGYISYAVFCLKKKNRCR